MQRARQYARGPDLRRHLDRRMIRDFVVAFLVFLGLALTFASTEDGGRLAQQAPFALSAYETYVIPQSHHGAEAHPAIATYDQPAPWPAFEPPPTLAVILVLAAMFAAFVTFNLAVARHLRCVSASPRRRSWRGG